MGKIESPAEAGVKAKEFIRKRHFKVKQILFREVHGEGNFWLMDGEVTFYEEMRRPQPKK